MSAVSSLADLPAPDAQARRLSATAAALDVGYESPTQFTREYARAFGLPPTRDAARIVAKLRAGNSSSAGTKTP